MKHDNYLKTVWVNQQSHGEGERLRLTGSVQRAREQKGGVASGARLEIHEIAPQDYAAHKRVNGKGERHRHRERGQ